MIKNKFNKSASLASLALASSVSYAETISFTDVHSTPSSTVDSAKSFAGSFNILDLLPSGSSISDFEVQDATVKVMGYSDANVSSSNEVSAYDLLSSTNRSASRTGYQYVSGYSYCSWWGNCYSRPGYSYSYTYYVTVTDQEHLRDNVNRYVDLVQDQMQLAVGDQNLTDTVDMLENSSNNDGRFLVSNQGSYSNGFRTYKEDRYTEIEKHHGDLSISASLSDANIADLAIDGILSFDIFAAVGNFKINEIELDVTLSRISSSVSVPEPSTFFLMLSALGFGVIRRFNSKGKAIN